MGELKEVAWLLNVAAMEEAERLANEVHETLRSGNLFESSDNKFVKPFRITKPMADELINTLEPHLPVQSRLSSLTAEDHVFGALRFFASGSYQQDIGQNHNICLSQSSVSRSIHQVIAAVHDTNFFTNSITFPSTLEQLNEIRQSFYNNYGFPGVIGSVDCTHVAIFPPKKNDPVHPENIYVNRKNYHSINVQLISDANLRILNVNAKYPGSTHDSFIWNNSNVLPAMQVLHRRYPGSYYLLGDPGYALWPWLLTPILNAMPESPESIYNYHQMSARNTVERLNGVLKMRFRCLLKHRTLHYDPETASKIINTCCALHNMCIQNNLEEIGPEMGDDPNMILDGLDCSENVNEVVNPITNSLLTQARTLQASITRRYFTR